MTTVQQPRPQQSSPEQTRGNGLAVGALVLGLIAFVLCPFEPVNVLGFLCGLVGVGLAIPALITGARRESRVGMAVTALVLSLVGAVVSPIVGIAQQQNVGSANATSGSSSVPSYSAPAYSPPSYPDYSTPSYSTPSYTPPAPETYTYRITGSGKASTITYSATGGNTSQVSTAKLPWSKKVEDPGVGGMTFAYVSAQNNDGGTISCQIVGPGGQVVSENSSEGQYAIVTCQSG